MRNQTTHEGRVCRTRTTVFGEFVELEIPLSFLQPDEAEQLGTALIIAAHQVRERRTQPPTRPLPLSEAFSLETAGASGAQTRRTGTPGGDTLQEVGA